MALRSRQADRRGGGAAERVEEAKQPTPLAQGAHGGALGTRRDRFSPVGVWSSVAVILLACVGIGVGLIVASPWVIGGFTGLALLGSAAAWAFGIFNDTQ